MGRHSEDYGNGHVDAGGEKECQDIARNWPTKGCETTQAKENGGSDHEQPEPSMYIHASRKIMFRHAPHGNSVR